MPNTKITKPKTIEDIKAIVSELGTGFDARYVLGKVEEERKSLDAPKDVASDSFLYKAMTLFEFDKGILMLNAIPELHRVFALELSKNLQKEYDCKTPSEKSLAEIVALNFIRVLAAQKRINSYLDKDSVSDIGVGYLNIISKELDRAERHYLTSLEFLRMLHSPSFNVNIKTNTAVVGHNQAVQVKNA